jgi:hypothetical protein
MHPTVERELLERKPFAAPRALLLRDGLNTSHCFCDTFSAERLNRENLDGGLQASMFSTTPSPGVSPSGGRSALSALQRHFQRRYFVGVVLVVVPGSGVGLGVTSFGQTLTTSVACCSRAGLEYGFLGATVHLLTRRCGPGPCSKSPHRARPLGFFTHLPYASYRPAVRNFQHSRRFWQQLVAEPHGRHGQEQRELRVAVGEIEALESDRSGADAARCGGAE